jgi:hypothetical protein
LPIRFGCFAPSLPGPVAALLTWCGPPTQNLPLTAQIALFGQVSK